MKVQVPGFSVGNLALNFTLGLMITAACFRRKSFKAVDIITGGLALDSKSYMIFVNSQAAQQGHCVDPVQVTNGLRVQEVVEDFWTGSYLSKLGGGTDAEVFCRELGPELHFRLNDDCSMFQAEIFAILKAIKAIAGALALDSES